MFANKNADKTAVCVMSVLVRLLKNQKLCLRVSARVAVAGSNGVSGVADPDAGCAPMEGFKRKVFAARPTVISLMNIDTGVSACAASSVGRSKCEIRNKFSTFVLMPIQSTVVYTPIANIAVVVCTWKLSSRKRLGRATFLLWIVEVGRKRRVGIAIAKTWTLVYAPTVKGETS